MKILQIIFLTMSIALIASIQSFAADHTGHQDQSDHEMVMDKQQAKEMFLEKREIDGYTVQFHVMEVTPKIENGESHNFMIKVDDQGKVLEDLTVNSKIIFPEGEAESKYLKRMGDWYMSGYNLNEKGKYQLIILFKTADGKKHKGGVYYERN